MERRGIPGWIDDQMALPATSTLAALRADLAAFPNPTDPTAGAAQPYAERENWNAGWWKIAATAPDQLRQRVAFALSEILVVGHSDILRHNLESSAAYYDLLVNGAFGNFRQLHNYMRHWHDYTRQSGHHTPPSRASLAHLYSFPAFAGIIVCVVVSHR